MTTRLRLGHMLVWQLAAALILLGLVLVTAFFVSVGPYLASQTMTVWMAFGMGLAFIAYGKTNVSRQWVSVISIGLGTIWIGALLFTIFGVADL